MNKIYDKLLLAVALLILAGGVFLYMQKSGATPSSTAPIDVEPADNPYQPVPVAESGSVDANWPEAGAQPAGPLWIYDVFTPPKIYIDTLTNQFSADPPVKRPDPVPFDVYLASIDRNPYRIQLEGYIEEDRTDPTKTLLLMYDEEAEQQVRARPGDDKPDAEFKLLDFDIQRVRDADNNVEITAKATILDQRSGEEVVLVHGERKFESGVTVVMRSEQDTGYSKELTEAPANFEAPLGTYTLLEINLEESAVTVEKQATAEGEEPETRILKPRAAAPSTPPVINTPTNNTNEASENFFDLL